MNKQYCIYTACNCNVMEALVSLASFKRFHEDVDAFLFTDLNIVTDKEKEVAKIKDIAIIDYSEFEERNKFQEVKIGHLRWPKQLFTYLYVVKYFDNKYDYAIKIDNDVLFMSPLDFEEITPYEEMFSGIYNFFNAFSMFHGKLREQFHSKLLSKSGTNMGLVVINIKEYINNEFEKIMEQSYQEIKELGFDLHNVYADQGLFAYAYLKYKIPFKYIDEKYNYTMSYLKEYSEDIKMIHYTGIQKPWKDYIINDNTITMHKGISFDFGTLWIDYVKNDSIFANIYTDLVVQYNKELALENYKIKYSYHKENIRLDTAVKNKLIVEKREEAKELSNSIHGPDISKNMSRLQAKMVNMKFNRLKSEKVSTTTYNDFSRFKINKKVLLYTDFIDPSEFIDIFDFEIAKDDVIYDPNNYDYILYINTKGKYAVKFIDEYSMLENVIIWLIDYTGRNKLIYDLDKHFTFIYSNYLNHGSDLNLKIDFIEFGYNPRYINFKKESKIAEITVDNDVVCENDMNDLKNLMDKVSIPKNILVDSRIKFQISQFNDQFTKKNKNRYFENDSIYALNYSKKKYTGFSSNRVLIQMAQRKQVFSNLNKIDFNLTPSVYSIVDDNDIMDYIHNVPQNYKDMIVMENFRKSLEIDFYAQFNKLFGTKPTATIRVYAQIKDKELLANQNFKDINFVENVNTCNNGIVITYLPNEYLHSKFIVDIINTFKVFNCKEVKYNGNVIAKNKNAQNDHIEEIITSKIVRYSSSKEKKLSIIIPIYNNGKFLMNLSFLSICSFKYFDDCEIILVDDGSTDNETTHIIDDLVHLFDNIVAYKYDDGGSGTASRARNKGIELSTADHIIYLDPDNKYVTHNLEILFENMHKGPMVSGGYYTCNQHLAQKKLQMNGYYNSRDFNLESKFYTINPQSTIFEKDTAIQFINGQLAQDTLYALEFLEKHDSIYFIDIPISVYFTYAMGSVTNKRDDKWLSKFMLVNKATLDSAVRQGFFEEYARDRYEGYFFTWILPGYLRSGHANLETFKELHDLAKIFDGAQEFFESEYRKEMYQNIIDKDFEAFYKKNKAFVER